MKCHQARKFVEAFSDGELDVARNLEVLEHLNMCPACTQRASDIPALKAALSRRFKYSSPMLTKLWRLDDLRGGVR